MDGRFDKPNSFGLCQGGENLPEREDCELCQGGKLNEKESIELIARMISETKSRFEVGDGNILLSWGILTATIATVVWAAVAATGNPAFNGLSIAGWP